MSEAFTIWTVRLATLLYVSALAIWVTANSPRGRQLARLSWTAACLCYLAHVYGAFAFVHGWSHAAAYLETARQTQELFGLAWGGGIYFNYAFTILWPADVVWWWSDFEGYRRRPRWVTVTVHTFLAFMFFNGAVVFGSGPVRWLGIAALPALFFLWRKSGKVGDSFV